MRHEQRRQAPDRRHDPNEKLVRLQEHVTGWDRYLLATYPTEEEMENWIDRMREVNNAEWRARGWVPCQQ